MAEDAAAGNAKAAADKLRAENPSLDRGTAMTQSLSMRNLSEQGQFQSGRALVNKMSPLETFANCIIVRCLSADQIVSEADGDNSGELDADEWMDLCANTLRLPLTPAQIMDVFELIDADKSGTCSAQEMKEQIGKAMKLMEAKVLASAKPADEDLFDERLDTKLVGLVAHNNMKPAMMSFVAQHRDFFKTVQIVTTGSTGAALEKKLGLQVATKVASGPLGGDQEIGGMITNDAVAVCFFFIDPLSSHPHEADIKALTRICEVHNTACATNPATGEALVHAFLHNPAHIETLYKTHKRRESMVVQAYKADQKKVINKVADKKEEEKTMAESQSAPAL